MWFNTRSKQIASAMLGGLLVLGAAACNSDATGAAGDEGVGAEAKKYFAMSFPNGDVQIWNDVLDLMKPQIEEAGYGFLTHNPQNNAQTQVADWQAWIQRGDVAAIMGFPVQADALVPVTQEGNDAGVTVISYASTWEGARLGLTVDDFGVAKTLGSNAGAWIAEQLNGSATVAVITNRTSDLGIARADGMLEGIAETAPDAKVKEIGVELSRQSAYEAAKAQLAAEPDTTVWIAMTDDPAKGVYRALLDAGVDADDPGYFLGSLDATEESLKAVAVPDSIYRVAYIVTAEAIADLNVRAFMAVAEGEEVQPENVTYAEVTSENVSEFLE